MKEKRKGPIGRAAELAEGFAATVRRMQREREPRVLVYDETGYARLVQPDGRGYERLLETAERMVALVDEADAAPEQAPARRRSQPRAAEGEGQPSKRTGAQSKTKPRSAKRRAAGGKAADTSARKSASRSRPKRPAKGDG